jgi:hypothetical protein
MTKSRRRLLLAVVLGGFVACFGCNPAMFPVFLQGESHDDATLKRLALEDKSKDVKVAVIVSSKLDPRQELRNVDRDLAQKTVEQIRMLTKANEDKLTVVDPGKVGKFLTKNPDWKNLEPDELADRMKEALKVDYVIDVEIEQLSLYEHNNHELYRGRAQLQVHLLDTNDADDVNAGHKELHALYPNEYAGGGIQADLDTNVFEFRERFVGIVAKKIAYCFCEHATINQMDDTREGAGE